MKLVHSQTYTTLDRIIIPDTSTLDKNQIPAINDPKNFKSKGYGLFTYGSGVPYVKRTDLMPVGYQIPNELNTEQIFHFFTISDIHITDKESPAQLIYYRKQLSTLGVAVYSPQMLYTTHTLNATVGTINDLHDVNPFNIGLALGDMTNSTQYNELRWFIDVLDGDTIKPYSGGIKDPVSGSLNDYQDKYVATGLNKAIPWYATIGNHDHFWMGSKPVNDKFRKAYIGNKILKLGQYLLAPNGMTDTTYCSGTIDGSTPYGTIIGEGRADTVQISTVVADSNRRSLSTRNCMSEFNKTSTLPVGHGFGQGMDTLGACYSFVQNTNSDISIKVIVLDDTQNDNDPAYLEAIYAHGKLDSTRFHWLMTQLKAGQDNHQLMIIAAHIPIGVLKDSASMGWVPTANCYKNQKDLIDSLKRFPNLILWVAGHRHMNAITAFPDLTGHPENGFWQVETKSLREFPAQLRTFDIMLNSDTTISIFATNVDVDVDMKDTLASTQRHYAIAANQIYKLKQEAPNNAELIEQLSPEMKDRVLKINAITAKQFHVSPNPATDLISIEVPNVKGGFIDIYNNLGQLKIHQSISQDKTEINISGLSKGIYMVKIHSNGLCNTTKLIKN